MIIISVIIFLLSLTIMVGVHEFGHFATAKKFGVYCREFAIGMGPKIWSKQKGETTYSFRAIPMGGFVQMVGEDGELFKISKDDEIWLIINSENRISEISYQKPENPEAIFVKVIKFSKETEPMKLFYLHNNERRTSQTESLITCYDKDNSQEYIVANNRQFNWLPPLKKIVVLTAGIFMNFILGFILVFAATAINGVTVDTIISMDTAELSTNIGDRFEPNDEIIGINGVFFSNYEEMIRYVRARPGQMVNIQVERVINNRPTIIMLKREIVAIAAQELTDEGINDFEYGALQVKLQRSHTAFGKIISVAFEEYLGYFQYMFYVLGGIMSGTISLSSMSGFIGIAQLTNAVLTQETLAPSELQRILETVARMCNFIALLSVNLGVINLLPFPALDGGRVVFALYELITRRKPNAKLETYANIIGFALIIVLTISITFMDISRLFS
jgi:Predicted membrane-associated Zn-dependent proteases 1